MSETEQMNFRTKGKWYLAEDVDNALNRLAVEREELSRELEALKRRLRTEAGNAEDTSAQKTGPVLPEGNIENSVLHQKKVREELEQERDELIHTIRMLRRLRDTFQASIRRDAQMLTGKLDEMESKGIL